MFDTGLVNLGDWTICETQTCQWTDPKIRPSSNLVGGVQASKSRTSKFVGEGKRRNEFVEWHVAWLAE